VNGHEGENTTGGKSCAFPQPEVAHCRRLLECKGHKSWRTCCMEAMLPLLFPGLAPTSEMSYFPLSVRRPFHAMFTLLSYGVPSHYVHKKLKFSF